MNVVVAGGVFSFSLSFLKFSHSSSACGALQTACSFEIFMESIRRVCAIPGLENALLCCMYGVRLNLR